MLEWPNIDFNLLKKINPDTLGWIHMEGTEVNYPVVRKRGDGYYLNHNFSGEESPHGCIFADTDGEFPGKRSMLSGHNMRDGSMFVNILFYYYEEGYYEKHPFIDLKTPDADYEIKVWGCIHFPYEYDFMLHIPKEKEAFCRWKEAIRNLCPFDPGFDLNYEDPIMVLRTCRSTYPVPDGTLMVVGTVIPVKRTI